MQRKLFSGIVRLAFAAVFTASAVMGAPVPIGTVSGTAPSGLSWQSIATGTALPVVVNGTATATPGAYALWNVRNGVLQLHPNGLSLNSFSFVYTSGAAVVSSSTPGPLNYPQGTSPATLQVSGTSGPADQRALPAGTWNNVTVWGARVGGTVARSPTGTPTLATAGSNTASTDGWLNQTWTFPSTIVTSGSIPDMIASDWRSQGVSGNPNANVVGFGDYQGTFTYAISGTSMPGVQVGAVVPTGLLSLTWNTTNGNWDHTASNWVDPATLPANFYNLDRVAFSSTAGGAVNVSGTQSPSEFAISATSGTYSFSGGSIGGYANLAKTGGGTAVFSSANSWTGGTTLSAGTIRFGDDAALGTGAVALNGGTIASANSSARVLSNAVNVGGDVTVGDAVGTGSVTIAGAVSLGGANRTLTTVANTTLSGAVSNGSLTKAGAGTLAVTGTASLTGTTSVNAGALSIASGGSLASTSINVASGATLSVDGLARTFGGGSLTVDGMLSGVGTIEGESTIRGVHAPGNSAPGTQTFLGDLFYQQAGVAIPEVKWQLYSNTSVYQAGTTFDQIVVQNGLTFGAPTKVDLKFDSQGSTVSWNDPFWAQNETFIMYDVGGTTTGVSNVQVASSTFNDAFSNSLESVRPGAHFLIQQQGNDVAVVYFATPEPSTWVMALVGSGMAAVAGWRRRSKIGRGRF